MTERNIRKLVMSALFAAISLTLFLVEAMIPPIVPIPGVKIGLAYLPVMLVMFVGGNWKIYDAVLILFVRVVLSALISGNLVSVYFSALGGLLSVIVMSVMKLTVRQKWAVIPAGVFSATAHNVGQLTAAMTVYSVTVWAYLPYLLISAVLTGLFSGFVIYQLIRKDTKIIKNIKNI
ncbi:MAG: Gx transporter family protein [Ruminiclostridium sp.]|nr:Gx transporter family protein [Ruminiclostridium sp.]